MMRGVRQIVRFNWPFYAAGTSAIAFSVWMTPLAPAALHGVLYAGAGLAVLWIVTSLAASWIVYDRSRLIRWHWIADDVRIRPGTWINIHAGLDESTPALRALFPGSHGRIFDIFDPREMTERSIGRARRLARNEVAAERADFRHLPAAPASTGAVFLLLSAHELRTDSARDALFAEIRRVLAPSGRVVVAEHLRDWANFIAFGPGFRHFHSRGTWRGSFARSGFDIDSEWSITPFVRVFVLRRAR